MADSQPADRSQPTHSGDPIDWEAFYSDFRKPGYIQGYEILQKLGGGVFGIVYRARKESIGRDYAIKFLKVDDESVRDAVLRELGTVSLFAQVDHPNLVSIEDRGEIDGIPYIVMGYAGDQTLRSRLDAGPIEREEALRLFVQIARGVQALHDRSLVHFDLKPANVFLRGDLARVGDYGLSKLVAGSRNSMSFGRGTPYYMAPEMLVGRGDASSDIYSLGVILFELLTGQVPFRGDSEWEVLRQHENAEAVIPDTVGSSDAHVLRRCLAKAPADRFESVAEILEGLGISTLDPAMNTRGAGPAPVASLATPQSASPRAEATPAAANAAKAAPRKAARLLLAGLVVAGLVFGFAIPRQESRSKAVAIGESHASASAMAPAPHPFAFAEGQQAAPRWPGTDEFFKALQKSRKALPSRFVPRDAARYEPYLNRPLKLIEKARQRYSPEKVVAIIVDRLSRHGHNPETLALWIQSLEKLDEDVIDASLDDFEPSLRSQLRDALALANHFAGEIHSAAGSTGRIEIPGTNRKFEIRSSEASNTSRSWLEGDARRAPRARRDQRAPQGRQR